uniref:Uncharacterized protein n=1 Tax=Ralstonia syzygii R24 TaxID=907261 RepID=G3A6D2_9RALS|nr:conserved hypothetical protein [Ralstonia syzygii R24]
MPWFAGAGRRGRVPKKKNALIPETARYQGKYGHGSLFPGRERTHEGPVHSQVTWTVPGECKPLSTLRQLVGVAGGR